nr:MULTISPECIES: hypothetical protein [Protofrankia]
MIGWLDGYRRLTGEYALGPEAGERLQQATLAIRARAPLDVVQPFPSFSEIYVSALKALCSEIMADRYPVRLNLIAPGFVDTPLSASSSARRR